MKKLKCRQSEILPYVIVDRKKSKEYVKNKNKKKSRAHNKTSNHSS